ncbi:hypothetical protein KCMC57_up50210 [Kitasatospora sp. CMC57]|uniref:Immunity protein 53 of polymorphic toxin system n=1 Tax=Kitasatospora sp. CMC57 TaxID=3231513 RepID=A0AB33KB85_9ACTN
MPLDPLGFLTAWYTAQCDGDWEHEYGIRIETLDNPGWSVEVDLEGTGLDGVLPDRIETDEGAPGSMPGRTAPSSTSAAVRPTSGGGWGSSATSPVRTGREGDGRAPGTGVAYRPHHRYEAIRSRRPPASRP